MVSKIIIVIGTAPLTLKTGRYNNVDFKDSLCPLCDLNAGIQSGIHDHGYIVNE